MLIVKNRLHFTAFQGKMEWHSDVSNCMISPIRIHFILRFSLCKDSISKDIVLGEGSIFHRISTLNWKLLEIINPLNPSNIWCCFRFEHVKVYSTIRFTEDCVLDSYFLPSFFQEIDYVWCFFFAELFLCFYSKLKVIFPGKYINYTCTQEFFIASWKFYWKRVWTSLSLSVGNGI